jgi:PPOX class probable F420-dependent enzyme
LLGSLPLMALTDRIDAFLAEPRTVIVAGTRGDGRPQLTPNWFLWDGNCFSVSTTRTRAKYRIFKRDPRAELAIDDSTGGRCVLVSGIAEIREDIVPELDRFRAIREKHGVPVPSDDEFLASLRADDRVLLVITPNVPPSSWTTWGLD